MEEPQTPQLTRAEQIFVRIALLQTALAVIGIFTGAVALYAALTEADAVRKQLKASVWPYVELGTDRWTAEAAARSEEWKGVQGPIYRFTVQNSGIGPAKISAVRVTVDGVSHRTWDAVMKTLTGRDDFRFGSSSLSGRVIQAGERISIVTLTGEAAQRVEDKLLHEDRRTRRVDTRICYCSVFDTCWLTQPADEPRLVSKCPDFGDQLFVE